LREGVKIIHQSSDRVHWRGFMIIIRKGDNCFLISDDVFQVDINRCSRGTCALHINARIYPFNEGRIFI